VAGRWEALREGGDSRGGLDQGRKIVGRTKIGAAIGFSVHPYLRIPLHVQAAHGVQPLRVSFQLCWQIDGLRHQRPGINVIVNDAGALPFSSSGIGSERRTASSAAWSQALSPLERTTLTDSRLPDGAQRTSTTVSS
jgi:hypothetical protein